VRGDTGVGAGDTWGHWGGCRGRVGTCGDMGEHRGTLGDVGVGVGGAWGQYGCKGHLGTLGWT